MPLRVAAISFLNPAPLLYNFEHEPAASFLRERYDVHYTSPSACAAELIAGTADLGLIPIAALTPEMAIVPGCTIASMQEVRSILLLVKNPLSLSMDGAIAGVKTIAADAASRSSQAYAHILFEHFHKVKPEFIEQAADPLAMLTVADAALLIGDPALLSREHRASIEAKVDAPLLWLDLAQLWRERTGLPWVAAVWALRPEALVREGVSPQRLVNDLVASRDAGMSHVEELVAEWTPQIAISPATIRTYLTQNIHYVLDEDCMRAIALFRKLAAEIGLLTPLPMLNILS
jgi:chorismate dehydratase